MGMSPTWVPTKKSQGVCALPVLEPILVSLWQQPPNLQTHPKKTDIQGHQGPENMNIHIYIYIHMHIYIYIYIQLYIYIYININMMHDHHWFHWSSPPSHSHIPGGCFVEPQRRVVAQIQFGRFLEKQRDGNGAWVGMNPFDTREYSTYSTPKIDSMSEVWLSSFIYHLHLVCTRMMTHDLGILVWNGCTYWTYETLNATQRRN